MLGVGEMFRVAMNHAGGRRREGPPNIIAKEAPITLPFPSSFAPCSPLDIPPVLALVADVRQHFLLRPPVITQRLLVSEAPEVFPHLVITSGGTAIPTHPSPGRSQAPAPDRPRSEVESDAGRPIRVPTPVHPRSEVDGDGGRPIRSPTSVHPRSEVEGDGGRPIRAPTSVYPRSEVEGDGGRPIRLPTSRSEHTVEPSSTPPGGLHVADTSHVSSIPRPGPSRRASMPSPIPWPTAAPEVAQPPPRRDTVTPFDFRVADESRGQLEELNEATNRLHHLTGTAFLEDLQQFNDRKKRRIGENLNSVRMKISENMNSVRMRISENMTSVCMRIIGKIYSSRRRRGGVKRRESDTMGSGMTWKIV